jgi:glycosyltransferase involved in cell wall biosynthesis
MVKVSIIVPCYNQAQYLNECLYSVLNQTYINWECIIVNDGSPDDTKWIAEKWLELDGRFKYLEQDNLGVSVARNFGITNADGKYILPLDADDKISPDYIKLAIRELESNEELKLVYCEAYLFGAEEAIWKLGQFSLSNLSKFNMIFCSAIYRKKDWNMVGGYDYKMVEGLEDWEFWISLLKNGGGVKKINIIGFYYRIKQNSRTKTLTPEKEKILYEYMSVKHAGFFVQQLGSFFELRQHQLEIENQYELKLKSEKFVIDLFLKTFFGFTIFGKLK